MSKYKNRNKTQSHNRQALIVFVLLVAVGLLFVLLVPSAVKHLRFSPSQPFREGFIPAPTYVEDPAVALCENMVVERWLSWRHRRVVQCSIYAKPTEGHKTELEKLVQDHDQQIRDNLRIMIANADTNQLMDPRLAYVKRCTQHTLAELGSETFVEKILVPEWKTYRP